MGYCIHIVATIPFDKIDSGAADKTIDKAVDKVIDKSREGLSEVSAVEG